MSFIIKAMGKFWENNSKNDAKLRATQTEPEGIERIYDIPYIDDGDKYHLLDVYYPEKRDGKLPVIIDVHGGGWMANVKDFNRLYCLHLAQRGFTVFNMNYRLVPAVTVKEQLQDVACALKWIGEHMAEYPCDPDKIMLTGDSAGGQLASYAAIMMKSEELRRVFGTVDFDLKLSALALTSPVAYMNKCGVMSIYTRQMWGDYKSGEHGKYMDFDDIADLAKLPPTYLVTSSGDMLGRKTTRRAAEKIRETGIAYKLHDYPKYEGENLPHVFAVLRPESKAGAEQIDEMIEFYKQHI